MCIALPFVAIGIAIQSPGPVMFKQTRIGKNGRRFEIYKFRSMYMDAEERKASLMKENEMDSDFMFKIKDDPRIFPVGKIIRKLSIDELPQAINIIKGDMSLVGTRPPTESEFEMYKSYHRRRVSIKPGLTGLWQVSGRSSITDFDEIVKLDCALFLCIPNIADAIANIMHTTSIICHFLSISHINTLKSITTSSFSIVSLLSFNFLFCPFSKQHYPYCF